MTAWTNTLFILTSYLSSYRMICAGQIAWLLALSIRVLPLLLRSMKILRSIIHQKTTWKFNLRSYIWITYIMYKLYTYQLFQSLMSWDISTLCVWYQRRTLLRVSREYAAERMWRDKNTICHGGMRTCWHSICLHLWEHGSWPVVLQIWCIASIA